MAWWGWRMPTVFADQARVAFAIGWAATGGPLTDRVKAASMAAVALAVSHADAPGVIEATMQLGSLEGTWAQVYARREDLYRQHGATVLAAWQALVANGFDSATVVGAFRRAAHLTESATTDDQRRRREREAAAIAAALAALHRLLADTGSEPYRELITAVEQSVRDGVAEGTAGAIAIVAQQLGHAGTAFDQAFIDARTAVTDLEQYQAQAVQWTKKTGEAGARELGRRLARQADDDASASDMVATADDTRHDKGWLATTVGAFTDWMIGHAFALGATAVYAGLSIGSVDWVTVGGGGVCPRCLELENGSPYALFGAPSPPAHPRCRCVAVPAGPVASLGLFAQYLTGG